jgi:prepilin-type N-terminal cleavage/methylation domain-containing protein
MRRSRLIPKRKAAAFTLIELLVVVSIIALLVSILLPSLSEARETGKRTVCLTNLRQIGTAMGSYFNEYSDIFPWFSTYEYVQDKRTNQSWFYGGRYPIIKVGANVAQDLRWEPQEKPFNAYLYPNAIGRKAECKLYKCPSEDGVRWVNPGSGTFEHDPRLAYLTAGTSYTANWWWIVYSNISTQAYGTASGLGKMPDYGNKMTRYKLTVQGAGIFGVMYGDPLDTMITVAGSFRGWHKKLSMSEMLFLDGHADFLPTKTPRSYRTNTSTWTLWFNDANYYLPNTFKPGVYEGIELYVKP